MAQQAGWKLPLAGSLSCFSLVGSFRLFRVVVDHLGVCPTTSVILLGIPLFIWGGSLWEALFVVSGEVDSISHSPGLFLVGLKHRGTFLGSESF